MNVMITPGEIDLGRPVFGIDLQSLSKVLLCLLEVHQLILLSPLGKQIQNLPFLFGYHYFTSFTESWLSSSPAKCCFILSSRSLSTSSPLDSLSPA